jgi:ureidoacrylate peracid hydrolase
MSDQSAGPGRASVTELLVPARSALLVIDVQNDYCHPDGLLAKHGADLRAVGPALANIQSLIEAARTAGAAVVFIRNWHEIWAHSAGWQARTTRPGMSAQARSWGAEFFGVAPLSGEPIIDKQRYNAFIGTPLDNALHTLGRDALVMTGFATNVCVESTARHAVFLDYRIVFTSDATGTSDGEEVHQATLGNIARHFGAVAPTSDIVAAWRAHAGRNAPGP